MQCLSVLPDYKEKKDSIKTLLLTLWKSEDDKVTKTESGELGSAVSAYIERIQSDRSIVPSFNTFYEYMRDDYRTELAQRDIKVEKSDFNIDNMLTTMRQYYRGGRYDFLLNSTENIDLLGKRFIVFEIDSIKENRELFPVVTIIIMEAFINKMSLFCILLCNKCLINRKSRIGNGLETSETLWFALLFHCFK